MGRSRIMLLGLVLASGALLLAACQPPPPAPAAVVVAPLPQQYTCAQQRQLANEYAALPTGSMLQTAIADYGRERKQLRAVHNLPDDKACP